MIRNALHRFAAASNRSWESDRSQTVGASEIGQCERRVFFAKNEGDHLYGRSRDAEHEDRWGARVRGTVYENCWWEPALRSQFGDNLLFAGADQRTFIDGFLSATPDGLVIGLPRDALAHLDVADIDADCILAECKTADPRTRLDEPKPEHVYQVQVQLGLVRARTNHRPYYALLSYTDTSFWDEVKEFPIRFDPVLYETAQRRATAIMTARSAADLKPEGAIAGGRECDHCPFTAACGRQRAAAVPAVAAEIDATVAAEIAALAQAAKRLRRDAERAECAAREIEHEVKERLAAAGTKKLSAGGVTVSWAAVKGRPSWDNKGLRAAAEAAGLDLSQFETVGDPSDRLTITIAPQSASEFPASAGEPAAEAA